MGAVLFGQALNLYDEEGLKNKEIPRLSLERILFRCIFDERHFHGKFFIIILLGIALHFLCFTASFI